MQPISEDFIRQMNSLLGEKETADLLKAIDSERVTSVRFNIAKCDENTLNAIAASDKIPWCKSGKYLSNRPLFTMDPLLHAGVYYPQEAASMFLEYAVNQHFDKLETDEPLMLDLCASPGGKSSILASILDGKGWLVANEVMKTRVGILNENLTKWGAPNVTVTQNDPKEFGKLPGIFDLILVDAPCSGEGMFRKDDKAIEDWSLNNVQLCCERQRRIVSDVFPALKENGLLVYSTCTYNDEENEKNVRWIAETLGADILKIDINPEWNITETDCGYHFYPHKTKGEGLFLAILQKTAEQSTLKLKSGKNGKGNAKSKVAPLPQNIKNQCNEWLNDNYEFVFENNEISAVSKSFIDYTTLFQQNLRTLRNGLPIGTLKGKDIIPDEALALTWALKKDTFPTVECDWKMAIQYLKKENLVLSDVPQGIVLFTFKNIPLGFGKNLGNRCNNLFPQEWRIRMEMDENGYQPVL